MPLFPRGLNTILEAGCRAELVHEGVNGGGGGRGSGIHDGSQAAERFRSRRWGHLQEV